MAAEAYFITEFSIITNPVRLFWYLQSNPLALVDTYDLPFPNIDGEETIITGLTSKLYRFEFWEMSGGTPASLIGKPIYLKPKGDKVAVELLHYTVGGPETWDPAPDQNTLTDSRLNGKTFHVSQRVNDWRQPADYAPITGGGFTLTTIGENFEEGDQWTVMVVSDVDTGDASAGGGGVMGIHLVSDSADFDSTYQSKHNISVAEVEGSTQVTTFPAFSIIPDNTSKFSTHSTNARYWRLQFNTGDTVKWMGEDRNEIVLRRGDDLELIFEGGVCYAIYQGSANKAGDYIIANKKLINTEFADGSENDIADYQDLIDRLPAEQKVATLTEWNQTVTNSMDGKVYYKNRGKFMVDTAGGVFKFPDLRDFMFKALKDNDGTSDSTNSSQGIGGLQMPIVGDHQHQLPIWADNPAAAFDVQTLTTPRTLEDFSTLANSKTAVHMTKDLTDSENTVKTVRGYALVWI